MPQRPAGNGLIGIHHVNRQARENDTMRKNQMRHTLYSGGPILRVNIADEPTAGNS